MNDWTGPTERPATSKPSPDTRVVEHVARLFSYVVARDYGFAPNPFFGCCSLATCKPTIRETARHNDWIVGTSASRDGPARYVVFVMRVTRLLTFNQYWRDPEYKNKKPQHASESQVCFRRQYLSARQRWSMDTDGFPPQQTRRTENDANIQHDTSVDRVLVSTDYRYWGRAGPKIPARFRGLSRTRHLRTPRPQVPVS